MYALQAHSRRLLQEPASTLASPPANTNINNASSQNDDNAFDLDGRFSPSMAVILVVLLSAFFFMAFFSVYVKRCSSRQTDDAPARAAAPAAAHDARLQGVDAAFLELLPLIAYSSAKKRGFNIECVVCLVDFEEGEPLCQLPRCKHVFHKDCIDMWLFSHTTCPLCRRSVISDGTRSFRWGVGSGSLRLSLGARGSRRHRSGRSSTGGPSTPSGAQEIVSEMAEHPHLCRIPHERLPRSHSTGHSMLKQWQRTELQVAMEEHEGSDEVLPSGRCLPLTPPAPFQRSRSVTVLGGSGSASAQVGIGGWVREAGASLKRVLSGNKRMSSAGASNAASSSASIFNRATPA